ncbi:MAG: aminoacyl-histidine dipeptidase [Clostridium sp.]
MRILQNIQPISVFKYFEDISEIPRGSGDEKRISDYLAKFGRELGLETIQDEALNIIIKKPGTKGYENAPTVIIQGHMDMVCEKNKGTNHDFLKDPLKLRVDGDYIYATDTTLGADNGIAVAYAMALLASNDIPHPPLEVLITSDEETGMTGAMAISPEHITGKLLINLDSEEEGKLLVSCAGGIRIKSSINILWDEVSKENAYEIKVRGLKGGHSGMEIHGERGNSNKLMGRVLKALKEEIDFNLISVDGGSKNNAIPREADAVLVIEEKDKEKLFDIVRNYDEMFKNELQTQDIGVNLTIENKMMNINKVFSKETTSKVIDLLYLYPNGVNTMSMAIKGLTESSTNLGIVTTTEESVEFDSATRSSVASLKDELILRCKTITELVGGEFISSASYPEWAYRRNSPLREVCENVYKRMTGNDAEIIAIHAGVECGLFNERLGDLDMISFGPNLYDVHTPEEHISISSTHNIWEYLKEVLKEIK